MSSKNNKTNSRTVSEKDTVLIYVGPNIKYLAKFTSYRNGYPIHLKEQFEKVPLLKKLFVKSDDFIDFQKNVSITGTAENLWYREVEKYFNKVVS